MANPTLLSRLLCQDADKNTIPDTDAGTAGIFSQQYGWQAINSLPLSAGGKAVQRQDFNGVFNLLGGIAFYAQKGYTFEWDIDQDYYASCVVTDPLNGNKYNAKNDVAKGGSNPSLDPTNWELFGVVDLSGKANISLDNLDSTGEARFANTMKYPDYDSEIAVANSTGGFVYTCPSDGFIKMNRSSADGGYYCKLYLGTDATGVNLGSSLSSYDLSFNAGSYADGVLSILLPAQKDDNFYFVTNSTSVYQISFVPAKA